MIKNRCPLGTTAPYHEPAAWWQETGRVVDGRKEGGERDAVQLLADSPGSSA
jgi:hypothetical protein